MDRLAHDVVMVLLLGIVSFLGIRFTAYALEMSVSYYRTAYDIEQVAFLTAVIGALGAVWLAGLSRAWSANGGSRGVAQRVGALIGLIVGATVAAGTVSEGLLRPGWLAFGGASLWASIQTFVSLKRDPKSPNAAER
jgi:hypothetical protein